MRANGLRVLRIVFAVSELVLFSLAGGGQARADSINKLFLPGKVIQGHARYESECTKCHRHFDKSGQSDLCKECHREIAKDIAGKRGYHGLMKEAECRTCHTEHKGRTARIAVLDTARFDHASTGYLLKGAHLKSKVRCTDCHAPSKKYRQAPTTCVGCHGKDDLHKGGLGTDCAACHGEENWKSGRFDHGKTHFPLLGKHVDVKCSSCHPHEKYKNTPTQCNECHRKDDKHRGNFGIKCESCHTDRAWKEIVFDHDKDTKYPLLGKHRALKCTGCHRGDLLRDTLRTDCNSCHTKDDKHKGRFGTKCESCHSERDWKEPLFDHARKTRFPLLGKHRSLSCKDCHKGDLHRDKLRTDCNSCHAKDDKHKTRFGTKCETCHSDREWKEILFDHDRKTRYPLRGKHREAKCTDCHKGNLYAEKLAVDCYSCHRKDDKHAGQQGQKCGSCHQEQSWRTRFDHLLSHFPLTGRHTITPCRKCHVTARFKDARPECASCHGKQDVHRAALGPACGSCHNTRSWKDWDFNHDKTHFKLLGKHGKTPCAGCHTAPVKDKVVLSTTCVSCHGKDDRHDGAFGPRCERCHAETGWKSVSVGRERWSK